MKDKKQTKEVKIKYKIDADFVLNLYEKAKKEKGKKREELMQQVYFFSENMGKYLAK
tara:strand:+ start:44 stop:214 length:171 start_codon:yes stop_codon:yes gene_type:complete